MKRIISILLILCMLSVLLVSCGNSDTDTDDGKQSLVSQYSLGLAYEVSEKNPSECIITGIGSCTDKNIVIPTFINGMRVVGVKDGAFSPKKQELALGTKVGEFIANDVTDTMLENMDSQESGGLGGGFIFDQIQADSSINTGESSIIVNGVYQPLGGANYETGTGTPIELTKIESIQIPFTVKEIGDEAFYGCEDLSSINAHNALSAIGKDAFKETAYYNNPQNWEGGQVLYLSNYLLSVSSEYTGEFTVKEGTTMVADQAFYKCSYITTVNMADSVKTVGSYAFYGCTNLTTYNFSTSNTITYASGAFDGCVSFKYEIFSPDGTLVNPDAKEEEETKHPTEFDKITSEQFYAIKENKFTNYIAETTNNQDNYKEMIYVDSTNRFYNIIEDDSIVKKICADDFGTYMYVGNKLHPTIAEIPDKMEILKELEYEHLGIYDAKANTYAYLIGEGEANRIEFGFKDGDKLVYLKVIIDGEEITTHFYDFGTTSMPNIDKSNLDDSITVDANGEAIN